MEEMINLMDFDVFEIRRDMLNRAFKIYENNSLIGKTSLFDVSEYPRIKLNHKNLEYIEVNGIVLIEEQKNLSVLIFSLTISTILLKLVLEKENSISKRKNIFTIKTNKIDKKGIEQEKDLVKFIKEMDINKFYDKLKE